MTQEEVYASHGKLIAEYVSTKNKLVALRAEARRIADAAQELREFIYMAHPQAYRNRATDAKAFLPPDKIVELLNQISNEAERLQSIIKQLSGIGVDVDSELLRPFANPNA